MSIPFNHLVQCTLEHDYDTECCTCPDQPAIGPHRFDCPRGIAAKRRIHELMEQADDMGIGYGVEV